MQITDIRINGMKNPVGYEFNTVRISWKVRNTEAKKQTYAKVEVAEDKEFEKIAVEKEDAELNSASEKLEITLQPRTRYYVRVTVENELGEKNVSELAYFETAKMGESWNAKWITTAEEDKVHPVFIKNFSTEIANGKEVKSARLYISGLGLFTAYLNGKKIGNEVLTPYYSDYHEEEQYLTFDVTERIQKENKLEVSLGNGWYKGKFGLAGQSENFGNRFLLIAELHLTYTDGEEQVIVTDDTWSYIGSDIEDDSIYDGEIINHLLYLIHFFFRQLLSGSKRCDKCRKGTLKCLFHELSALCSIKGFPGHNGSDHAVLIFHDAFLTEFAEHRVGCGFLPLKLLAAQLH